MKLHAAENYANEIANRVDRGLKGAIMAGYDGVDVLSHPHDPFHLEIKPWNYPEPEPKRGYTTERYTWDYFTDEELTEICQL